MFEVGWLQFLALISCIHDPE